MTKNPIHQRVGTSARQFLLHEPLEMAHFVSRLALAMILGAVCVGMLRSGLPVEPATGAWISQATVMPSTIYLALFGIAAVLLLTGWLVMSGAVVASLGLLMLAAERLSRQPFANLSTDLLPLVALALIVLGLSDRPDRLSVDRYRSGPRASTRWSWATLVARLFVGAIFFSQGAVNTFGAGPLAFAEKLYVKPFAGMMPEALLWVFGVANPLMQLVSGFLLITGFKTRWGAVIGLLFLLSIMFGHLLGKPFTAVTQFRDYAFANFVTFLAVLLLCERGNLWSVDEWIRRARRAI